MLAVHQAIGMPFPFPSNEDKPYQLSLISDGHMKESLQKISININRAASAMNLKICSAKDMISNCSIALGNFASVCERKFQKENLTEIDEMILRNHVQLLIALKKSLMRANAMWPSSIKDANNNAIVNLRTVTNALINDYQVTMTPNSLPCSFALSIDYNCDVISTVIKQLLDIVLQFW